MSNVFNPENKFWSFIGKIADVFCISILWVVCSLPIITAGAANAAMHHFSLHLVDDTEDMVLRGFFRPFKAHFKKASLVWLIQLALGLFLGYDCYLAWHFYVNNSSMGSMLVLSVVCCVTLIFIMMSLYIYPLLVTFDFQIKKLLKDSIILSVGNLWDTITIMLIWFAATIGIFYFSGVFFIFVGLAVFFSSYVVRAVFLKYTEQETEQDELQAEQTAAK